MSGDGSRRAWLRWLPLVLLLALSLGIAAAGGSMAPRRHRVGRGQSAAIVTGVRAARGAWVATLDGDGQNDPADIPALFERARRDAQDGDGAYVLVVGHRTRRRDGAVKRLTSRAANRVRAALLGDATPDTGGTRYAIEFPCQAADSTD